MKKFLDKLKIAFKCVFKFFNDKNIKLIFDIIISTLLFMLFIFFINGDIVKSNKDNSTIETGSLAALTDRQQIDNSNNKFFNDTLIGSLIDLGSLIVPSQDRVYSQFETSCGSFYLCNYNNNYPSDYADEHNTEIYDSFGILYPYAIDGNTIDYHFMPLYQNYSTNDTVWFTSNGDTYNVAFFNPSKSPLHTNISLKSVQLTFSRSYLDSDDDGRYYNVLSPFKTCISRLDYRFNDLADNYDIYSTKTINTADRNNVCQIRFDYKNFSILPEFANGYSGYFYENYTPVFSVNLSDIRYEISANGYDDGYRIGYNNGLIDSNKGANPIFNSIKNGIGNFFDISLFGGFQVGHLLLIGLGVIMIKVFITQFLT